MNYVDFIIIGITLLLVLSSARKGLLTLAIEMLGYIVAVPMSIYFSRLWAEPFYVKFVQTRLSEFVCQNINQFTSPKEIISAINDIIPPEILGKQMNYDILSAVNNLLENVNSSDYTQILLDNVLKPIAVFMCTGVLLIIVLLAVLIVFKILAKLTSLIKLPKPLSSTNHFLGGAAGFAKACIIVVVLSTSMNFISTFSYKEKNEFLVAASNSKIIHIVNSNNPLQNAMEKRGE